MGPNELRAKDDKDLQAELHGLLREQFNLRMQHGAGQLPQVHQLKKVRRDIARVKTIQNQKKVIAES